MIPLLYLDHCQSTNDEIQQLLADTLAPFALYTFNQTKGRGQYGNSWSTVAGQNLAYSFALHSGAVTLAESLFNYHTATTIRDFIAKMTSAKVEIKWPNDIIIKEKKVAGILIEKVKVGTSLFYIVGAGINLLQNDFKNLPKAGSLLTQADFQGDIKHFVNEFHNHFSQNIFNVENSEKILENFNEHLFRKDRLSVFQKDGIRQNGIIQQADAQGFLWIELEHEGLGKYYHKEIELLY